VGRADPSGRLAETIPLRLQDNPSYLNFPGELGVVRYGEGVFVGYRGYDAREQEVSYPFGHGLSYTTFGYDDLDVTLDERGGSVSVTVTNTGSRAGKEVVQVYVSPPASAVARPVRALAAFAKVALAPGESRRVRLAVTRRDLSYFHPRQGRWVLEGGEYGVAVGASSRDLRLTATVANAPSEPLAPLAADASLEEWLAHPVGSRLLAERLAAVGPNMLADPEMRTVVGNFPLARLATFPGAPLTPAEVEELRIRATRE
jgi:beta-glucosidase